MVRKKSKHRKINSVLTEREKCILAAWKQDRTLGEIGEEHNVTGERVRQIIKKAITKQIINRQSEGFEIAADVTEFLIQKKKWWRAVKILGIK